MNFLPSRHGVGEETAWFAAGGGTSRCAPESGGGARHGVFRG